MSGHPWVCASCRSINEPRDGRCYHCRTPRELAEADPEKLLVAGAGSRPQAEVRPFGAYRSSAARALLTQVLIAVALGVTVVASFLGADLVGRFLDDGTFEEGSVAPIGVVGLTGLGLSALALVAFAAWLSRVVANVPTVGLGWPNVTPAAAIYESIFPGLNLYRVPAILRDITTRLEPTGRGDALIAASWLALVGGALMPRLVRFASAFVVGEIDELTRILVVINQLGLGLTVAGGALLIVLIQWIENRMAARAAEAPAPGTAAEPPEPIGPNRPQTLAEAAGTALGKPGEPPARPAAWGAAATEPPTSGTAPTDPARRAARPRWGGAVATPTSLSRASPADPAPEHGQPAQLAGDPDDWPIGTDEDER